MNKQNLICIHTDGACRGNPGPGGWGVLLQYGDQQKKMYGGEQNTTNNRMELMAAIMGLEALKKPSKLELNTDSTYVLKGITEWMPQWKKRDWRTAANKPVKNVDLWQRLDKATQLHEINWRWVKGHSGDPGNECADQLANQGVDTL